MEANTKLLFYHVVALFYQALALRVTWASIDDNNCAPRPSIYKNWSSLFWVHSKLLHSDNGREFVNEIIRNLLKDWPGEVVIINGRPRNPKCQGLIEQGNHMVEKQLGVRLHENKRTDSPWTDWLPLIQCT